MGTYIILTNYTQKGIESIKEGPKRLEAVKRLFREMGVEMKGFYLAQGRYDIVVIAEAPDDETMSKLSLAVCAKGSVRTEPLRAFTEDEYRDIIAALP